MKATQLSEKLVRNAMELQHHPVEPLVMVRRQGHPGLWPLKDVKAVDGNIVLEF